MNYKLLLFSIVFSINGRSQIVTTSVSYEYFYSRTMDKIVQTYNFDRPFLQNKQPLFSNGINASFSYFGKREKRWSHGLYSSYTLVQSFAENQNFTNRFLFHLIDLGYSARYQDSSKFGGFYSELQISSKWSGLFRRTNGEPFISDSTRSHSFGVGGTISFVVGYSFKLKNKSSISPIFQLSCTPYIYAPNTESVINCTKGLISKTWQTFFYSRIGIVYHFGN